MAHGILDERLQHEERNVRGQRVGIECFADAQPIAQAQPLERQVVAREGPLALEWNFLGAFIERVAQQAAEAFDGFIGRGRIASPRGC